MNTLVILILNILIFLVILVLIYLLLKFVIGSMKKPFARMNLDITSILVGLGISLPLFFKFFKDFFQDSFRFLIQLVYYPFNIVNSYSLDDNRGFIFSANKMYNEIQNQLIGFFSQLDFTILLLFSVTWFLISLFIKTITIGNSFYANEKLINLRKNVLSIAVLLFAAYLSLTAIIATPIVKMHSTLNESEERNKILGELDADLKMITIDYNSLYLDSLIIKQNSVDAIQTKLAQNDNAIKEDYLISINQYKRKIEHKKKLAKLLLEEALLAKVNDKRIIHYKGALTNWYFNYEEEVLQILNKKKHELLLAKSDTSNISSNNSNDLIMKYLLTYQNTVADENIRDLFPPGIPSPVDSFSVFGFVAGWLITTEDIAFVLIIGLLGFGLLGAAGSELIKGIKQNDSIIIGNLNGAIVKGTTAALVVFLAVKGGLAILTTNESENINPYALFFICFISSVYSSDVWEWAKKKLLETINTVEQKNQNPENQKK